MQADAIEGLALFIEDEDGPHRLEIRVVRIFPDDLFVACNFKDMGRFPCESMPHPAAQRDVAVRKEEKTCEKL